MATCINCGKRANKRFSCFYCGRRPMCIKCICPCRSTLEKEVIVAGILRKLDAHREV